MTTVSKADTQRGPHTTLEVAETSAQAISRAAGGVVVYVIRSIDGHGTLEPREVWYCEAVDHGMIRNFERVECSYRDSRRTKGA